MKDISDQTILAFMSATSGRSTGEVFTPEELEIAFEMIFNMLKDRKERIVRDYERKAKA